MMMQIVFEPANKIDIVLLQQLAQTIWHSHYPDIITVEQIDYMLDKMYSANVLAKEIGKGINWVIVKEKEQPIGFISFHLEEESRVKLSKLYILLQYHGKGIGAACLDYVKRESEKLNAKSLYLTVNKKNAKAIEAYKRAGFFIEKEVVSDIGNGYVMDDYIMMFGLGDENQSFL